MPFFLNKKTINEVRLHLDLLTIVELRSINQRYASYFEQLFDKKDKSTIELAVLHQKISALKHALKEHQLTYQSVNAANEHWQESKSQAVESTNSRTERYMIKNQYITSPLEDYETELLRLTSSIQVLEESIQTLGHKLECVKQNIALTIIELKILNSVLDRKEQVVANQNQPPRSLPI